VTYDIVLLGPPGAGKSTQAALLSDRLGLPCLATTDALPTGGCVLDGEPSTLLAARVLDDALRASRRAPDVIVLEIPDDLAVRRLTRRLPPRRTGVARRRIAEYRDAIAPVLAFFEARMLLHRIDASEAAAEVHDAIAGAIGLPLLTSPPPPAFPVRHVQAMDAMAAAHGYLVQHDDD
jgi:adenylate kinase family enzyme